MVRTARFAASEAYLWLPSVFLHVPPTPIHPTAQCGVGAERKELKRHRTSPACSELTHVKTRLPQSSATVLIPEGSGAEHSVGMGECTTGCGRERPRGEEENREEEQWQPPM
ncbi:hypothetical protein DPEC_G00315810 [Dallia pectoralis]|uniref:Uncharacterized protein n=1 Tax=Dallia pectoralis TaxID=75939 RepID=A0ACC2FCC8_DALPE|nr:hypothetical protein DPEC_G00315810 [Dallia pectoralis]